MPSKSSQKMKKPKRPLSAYNLFFRYERSRILKGVESGRITIQRNSDKELSLIDLTNSTENKTLDLEEVKEIVFRQPSNSKRQHRKTHGQISFTELIKYMCKAWATLEADSRQVFELLALEEKEQYAGKVLKYNKEKTECSQSIKIYNQLWTKLISPLKNHKRKVEQRGDCYDVGASLYYKARKTATVPPPNLSLNTGERKRSNFHRVVHRNHPGTDLHRNDNSLENLESSDGIDFAWDVELYKIFDKGNNILEEDNDSSRALNVNTSHRRNNANRHLICAADINRIGEANTSKCLENKVPRFVDEERDLANFLLGFDWNSF